MTTTGGGNWIQLKEHPAELRHVAWGLQDWLRIQLSDPGLTVGALRGPTGTGVANETLLFDARRSTGETDGYVARLATADPLYLDYDLAVHHRMYVEMMDVVSVPTPAVIGYEKDPELVGAPFFVMERVDGLIPSDNPSWGSEGFIVDATAGQRRRVWERTVEMMAELHRIDASRFEFLRTGAADDGIGDCLEFWMRSMRWADLREPLPLTGEAEEWLSSNQPVGTALSWGDSRLPNVIYRDYEPVALLDWDLVSLAGPQADLAWWILLTPKECVGLDGIGTHNELVDLWENLTGTKAVDLHWFLVFGAYRLAAIYAKLLPTFVNQGRMPAAMADHELNAGMHVQLLAGLLELPPPAGVTPMVPDVRCDR